MFPAPGHPQAARLLHTADVWQRAGVAVVVGTGVVGVVVVGVGVRVVVVLVGVGVGVRVVVVVVGLGVVLVVVVVVVGVVPGVKVRSTQYWLEFQVFLGKVWSEW